MKFQLEGITVYFPYEYMYPEQYQYMVELKHALDAKGHCLLEMPTGTGKTITLLSLITSYQLAHPEIGKLIYCTRTVPEMEKVLAELRDLFEYRKRYLPPGKAPKLLAIGLSSRKNLCVNPAVVQGATTESVDAACAERTASWVRARAGLDVRRPGEVARDGARRPRVEAGGGEGRGSAEAGPSGTTRNAARADLALGPADGRSESVSQARVEEDATPLAGAGPRRPEAAALVDLAGGGAAGGSDGDPSGGGAAGGSDGDPSGVGAAGGPPVAAPGPGSEAVSQASAPPRAVQPSSLPDARSYERAGLCAWYEALEASGADAFPDPGVYTLSDLRALGRKRRWCPYFLARRAVGAADVLVWNYQYMLDPKVSALVSKELESDAIVAFDEAHNIDNVCIEALSVELRPRTLDAAARSVRALSNEVKRARAQDESRLRDEYARLVRGLASTGALGADGADGERWLANPAVPSDALAEAVPGNVRRAEHFLRFLERVVRFLRARMAAPEASVESTPAFLAAARAAAALDERSLRSCHDRLSSLFRALEVVPGDDHRALGRVADLATLAATYSQGFAIVAEPHDDRAPGVPDPVLHLACLDASVAIRPTFARFRSVVITSGTLSPIDLYPKLLGFQPVAQASLDMTLVRACVRPIVVSRGADQTALSTRYDARGDVNVVRGYGKLLAELSATVPDGIVAFFVSYAYMDKAVAAWHDAGILADILRHKLVFVESADVLETTLALDNFRRACDAGRGAVFLSVARGKVAEGIDFDRHYGRAVVVFGVPYQYTLSRVLRARLEYALETHGIKESDYLAFDAVRQAAQCVGRVIRSKADYGLMVLADQRYARRDKRDKLPVWIASRLEDAHSNLSADMLLVAAREFLREMAQPYDARGAHGAALLSAAALDALEADRLAKRTGGGGAAAIA